MIIQCDRPVMVFYFPNRGTGKYKVTLARKDKLGNYEYGYITANFPKGTVIKDRSVIRMLSAWLTFYVTYSYIRGEKHRVTYPMIFIERFNLIREFKEGEKVDASAFDFTKIKNEYSTYSPALDEEDNEENNG